MSAFPARPVIAPRAPATAVAAARHMKIALILDSLRTGGKERQAVLSATGLGRCGHQIELITYHPGNDFVEYIRDRGIRLVRVDARGVLRLGRIRALAAHLRDGRFDIAHCMGMGTTFTGSVAARLADVPVVGGCRGKYTEHPLARPALRIVNRFLAGWIVNSRAVADTLSRTFGIDRGKCLVVDNGIDTEVFATQLSPAEAKERIGVDPSCPVVSIIAQLRPEKNHPLFLETAALTLEDHPDTRFVIAGDGECRSSLEQSARCLGIADRVLFLGNRPDVPDLLAATDVSVLTSHVEGLPNTLVESMCLGVPVVTTDYAGVDELVTDGREGFVAPCGQASALADRVGRLLQNEALRRQMGACGRRTVEARFSLHAMATNLVAAYGKCLERVGRSRPTPPGLQ